jgi:ABC-type sugar transport system ATPase subunit
LINGGGSFEGHVNVVEPVGSDVIGYLNVGSTELTVQLERDGTLQETNNVFFDFPTDSVHLFGDGRSLD